LQDLLQKLSSIDATPAAVLMHAVAVVAAAAATSAAAC
jgi:hypothetical protein